MFADKLDTLNYLLNLDDQSKQLAYAVEIGLQNALGIPSGKQKHKISKTRL